MLIFYLFNIFHYQATADYLLAKSPINQKTITANKIAATVSGKEGEKEGEEEKDE